MVFKMKFHSALAALFLLAASALSAQSGKFKVTLDAGHGGGDFGAIYNGHAEKHVALAIVQKVGRILESTPGFDVVYTRNSDVFIGLVERANIANRANSHIFVSIHCNANPNASAYGTETYVMGMAKNASNLAVAKKENAVITMEKDYKEKYGDFDVNSNFAVMAQEEYMENSIALASKIQNRFIDDLKKKSRGVKQAPYMVLHKAYMPRVLIETGFISNPEEGAKLDSEEGQQEIARAIANAIISYKKEYYGGGSVAEPAEKPAQKMIEEQMGKPETSAAQPETPVKQNAPVVSEPSSKGVTFKVQISASGKKLDPVPSNFKGLSPISITSAGNLYKYMYGETSDYNTAKQYLSQAKDKGFASAYVVAFRDGKPIKLQEALN
jgi:N-acetylmuramoyl-L-alanine amidase